MQSSPTSLSTSGRFRSGAYSADGGVTPTARAESSASAATPDRFETALNGDARVTYQVSLACPSGCVAGTYSVGIFGALMADLYGSFTGSGQPSSATFARASIDVTTKGGARRQTSGSKLNAVGRLSIERNRGDFPSLTSWPSSAGTTSKITETFSEFVDITCDSGSCGVFELDLRARASVIADTPPGTTGSADITAFAEADPIITLSDAGIDAGFSVVMSPGIGQTLAPIPVPPAMALMVTGLALLGAPALHRSRRR